jgi:DUF971 family protein
MIIETFNDPATTTPVELKKSGQQELKITWQDGHRSIFPFRYLRQNCPCAACRDEWSGNRTLDAKSVPEDLKGLLVNLVGNYAVHITFSDQHATGIFSFAYLRKICPCEICRSSSESTS